MFSFRGLRDVLVVLVVLVLFAMVSACAAQTTPIKRSSNVRKTASRTSAIVGTLNTGDSVTVLSSTVSAGYLHVRLSDGTEGWVLARNFGSAKIKPTTPAAGAGGFTQSCSVPQYPMAAPAAMDATSCPVGGSPSKNPQKSETPQNESKNNFCATGPVQAVTVADMVALQAQVPASVPFGQTAGPAVDRSALVALGEGQEVTVMGYLSYTDQEGAESVNCGTNVPNEPAYHDIHMNIVSTPGEVQCSGIVAEMIPHHRPAVWTAQLLGEVLSAQVLVRVTGNRMFDSSHSPCANGKAASGDPQRASLWEVHPIYKFEVCMSGTCSSGSGWVDLEAWKP